MAIGTLKAVIKLESKSFIKDLKQAQSQIGNFAKGSENAGFKAAKLAGFVTKLGGAFGAVTTVTQLVNKELAINGTLAYTVGGAIQSTTAAVDGLFLSINNGNFDGFIDGMSGIVRSAKDLYDTMFDLKEFEATNQIDIANISRQTREQQEIVRNGKDRVDPAVWEAAVKRLHELEAEQLAIYDEQIENNMRLQTDLVEALATRTRPDLYKDTFGMSDDEINAINTARANWEAYIKSVLSGDKSLDSVVSELNTLTEEYSNTVVTSINSSAGYTSSIKTMWDESVAGIEEYVSGLKNLDDVIMANIQNMDKYDSKQINFLRDYQKAGVNTENLLSNQALLRTANNRYEKMGNKEGKKYNAEMERRKKLLSEINSLRGKIGDTTESRDITFDISKYDLKTEEGKNKLNALKEELEEFGNIHLDEKTLTVTYDPKSMTEEQTKKLNETLEKYKSEFGTSINTILNVNLKGMTEEDLKAYLKELQLFQQIQTMGDNFYNTLGDSLAGKKKQFDLGAEFELTDVDYTMPDIEELEEEIEREISEFEANFDKERADKISELIAKGLSFDDVTLELGKWEDERELSKRIDEINEKFAQTSEYIDAATDTFEIFSDALNARPADNIASWAAGVLRTIGPVLSAFNALAVAKAANSSLFPANLIAISTTVAAIMSAVKTLPKFEYGGVVPGSFYSGDRVLARLNSGERVLTRQQNKLFESILRNGTNLNIRLVARGRDLVSVISNYDNYTTKITK